MTTNGWIRNNNDITAAAIKIFSYILSFVWYIIVVMEIVNTNIIQTQMEN